MASPIMGLSLAGLPQPMVERIASFAQRSDIPSLAATCSAANEACALSLLWKSHLVRMCPEMLAVCDATEAAPSYRAVVKQLVMKPEHTTPSAFRLLLKAGDHSCALQQCASCGEDFFGVLEGAAAAALYEQAKLCWSGAASAQPVELIIVEANSAALCKLELAYGAGDPRVKLPEDADDTALYDEDVAPYYAIVKEYYDIDGSDGDITGSADTFNEITRVKLAMCFDTVEACSDEESEGSAESSRSRPRPLSKVEEQLRSTINEAESRAVAAEGICTEAQQMTSAARAALQRASGWLSGSIFESAADKSEREALAAKCEAARKAEHHADLDQDIARGQLQALLHSRDAACRQRRREDSLAGLRATSVHLTVMVETELQQHSDGHRYQQQVDPSVILRTLPYALPAVAGGDDGFVFEFEASDNNNSG